MTITEFVARFAEEFDDTPETMFTPSTDFKSLDEWNSLTALSVLAMVDDELDKRITGADLRNVTTIENLYNLIQTK